MAERKYFGTDGIRGTVGDDCINPEFILKLGWAVGKVLAGRGTNKVLIGKDTRISGYMLESCLEAGLAAAGVSTELLGPMPTPAVAYLTRTFRSEAGIVISASHNPYHDNGIKFFSAMGFKLPDEIELEIEKYMESPMVCVSSEGLGKARRVDDAAGRYIEYCKGQVPSDVNLNGLKVVVDCAHGATYHIAPKVLSELGAEVVVIGASPNGLNINDKVGATELTALRAAVIEHQADLGFALDGDGDRIMLVDENGEVVDGDEIVFITARELLRQGKLQGGVVGTLMSNMGMQVALEELGIPFLRSKVGDRYVMELLNENGWQLGGESSGHVINLQHTTTGDGIVAGLQILAAMVKTGQPLSTLKRGMTKYPQKLINVRYAAGQDPTQADSVKQIVAEAEQAMEGKGRVLLRKSGTEPVVRVMVEASDAQVMTQWVNAVADAVKAAVE